MVFVFMSYFVVGILIYVFRKEISALLRKDFFEEEFLMLEDVWLLVVWGILLIIPFFNVVILVAFLISYDVIKVKIKNPFYKK